METRGLVNLPQGGRPGGSALGFMEHPGGRRRLRWWPVLVWAAVAGLLFIVLRQIPLAQVRAALAHLTLAQIGLLFLVNLAIVWLMTARWWLVLRALGQRVGLHHLFAYRLAGFGVSYFTPGPQFGGEPLQVHLLHRNQKTPLASAVTSVFLDRMIDLLVNFTFLAVGVVVVGMMGLVRGWLGLGMWALALSLLALPLLHLLALGRGRRPATRMLRWAQDRLGWKGLRRVVELAFETEEQVARFLTEQPLALARILGLSLFTWGVAIFEFWLCLHFLGAQARLEEAVSAMTAARLSLLMPLPGGLGALEAGQALAAQLLGWSPALGIALSLVIRARDVAFALAGLWFGGFVYRSILFRKFWERKKDA